MRLQGEQLPQHHHWNENLSLAAAESACEFNGSNSDSSEQVRIQPDGFSENPWISPKAPLPQPIAHDCHGMSPWSPILLGKKRPAQSRFHAQNRKEIPRDDLSGNALRQPVSIERQSRAVEGNQAGKDFIAIPKSAKSGYEI